MATGKADVAGLTLRARRNGNEIAIEIEDRGRGIDWTKVSERARASGLPSASQADLIEALFHDGLSTHDVASEISGRGIGLSALRHACTASGGHITITRRPGAGTTVGFRWSDSSARHEPLQIAG
jgi:two-component system chemotaxis sensor kinase CheA